MRYFFLIYLLVIGTTTNAQVVPSSCFAPDSIIDIYEEDATLLTLRRIFWNGDSHKDSIIIPQNYIDTVLNAMIAVHNANSIPERDTVIDIYDIGPLYNHGLHEFSIGADSSLAWMNELEIGNLNSGYVDLDNILLDYNFTQNSYSNSSWSWYASSKFTTTDIYNIQALTAPLSANPEVYFIMPGIDAFDGPDMLHIVNSDHVELRYMYRWGDCLAGCMYQRTWVFKVYFDCSVEFVESYDGPAPDASIRINSLDNITIGPNPFSGSIALKGIDGEYEYRIINMLGKVLVTNYNSGSNPIDLTILPKGTFIFQVEQDGFNSQKKIIKL